MKVELMSHTLAPAAVIASAAKLCYSKSGIDDVREKLTMEEINRFLKHLNKIGHESPFEHAYFTFAIEGISRACSHQIVRHRIASFSQQSQRYVKLDQFEYIIPPAIAASEHSKKLFIQHMNRTQALYDELVIELLHSAFESEYPDAYFNYQRKWAELSEDEQREFNFDLMEYIRDIFPSTIRGLEKKAIEDARYVFPNACETKMVVTMNARSLFNFFKHRLCNRAQWEIQQVAEAMLREVIKVAPVVFANVAPDCVHGKCGEGSMSCGKAKEMKEKYL